MQHCEHCFLMKIESAFLRFVVGRVNKYREGAQEESRNCGLQASMFSPSFMVCQLSQQLFHLNAEVELVKRVEVATCPLSLRVRCFW